MATQVILPALSLLSPAPADSLAAAQLLGLSGTHLLSRLVEFGEWSDPDDGWSSKHCRSCVEIRSVDVPVALVERVGPVAPDSARLGAAKIWVYADGSVYLIHWRTEEYDSDVWRRNRRMPGGHRVKVQEMTTTLDSCAVAFASGKESQVFLETLLVEGAEFCLATSGEAYFFGEMHQGSAVCLVPPGTPHRWWAGMSCDASRAGAMGQQAWAYVVIDTPAPAVSSSPAVPVPAPVVAEKPSAESLSELLGAFGRRV